MICHWSWRPRSYVAIESEQQVELISSGWYQVQYRQHRASIPLPNWRPERPSVLHKTSVPKDHHMMPFVVPCTDLGKAVARDLRPHIDQSTCTATPLVVSRVHRILSLPRVIPHYFVVDPVSWILSLSQDSVFSTRREKYQMFDQRYRYHIGAYHPLTTFNERPTSPIQLHRHLIKIPYFYASDAGAFDGKVKLDEYGSIEHSYAYPRRRRFWILLHLQ